MANQIKKKFIASDAVDGSKLKLLQGEAIRIVGSDGQEKELVKEVAGKVQVLGAEVETKQSSESKLSEAKSYADSQDESKLVEAKAYTDSKSVDTLSAAAIYGDQKRAELKSYVDSQDASKLAEAKSYADGKASQAVGSSKSYTDQEIGKLTALAPAALNTFKELADAIQSDESGIASLVSSVSSVQNGLTQEIADRQYQVQNEITARQQAVSSLQSQISSEASAREQADTDKLAEAKAYTDTKIATIPSADLSNYYNKSEVNSKASDLQSQVSSAIGNLQSYVDSQDASKLIEAKAYADSAVAAVKSELLGGAPSSSLDTIKELGDLLVSEQSAVGAITTSISALQQSLNDEVSRATNIDTQIQSDFNDLDAYAQDIRGDLDIEVARAGQAESALSSRVTVLENKADGPSFDEEFFTIGSGANDLSFIELSREVKEKSIRVVQGRLAFSRTIDFTVSVVGGKSRLTWIGSVAVGGAEALESGDSVVISYAY